jgi:High potential iron-sulfur protein
MLETQVTDTTRRIFITRTIAGGCAVLASPVIAQAAPSRVEETDETALALGYKHDTNKVDGQRFGNHSTAQRCANCSFFQGSANDDWGGCAMFGRKHIAAAGWCSAWAKKPG